MGDGKNCHLRVNFDSSVKLKFIGSKVTSDAGLLAYRELDEAFRLTEMGADVLTDSRRGSNKQHGLVPLLRQSIYSRLAGYEDVNDAERYRDLDIPKFFRGDAAFANPALYRVLEEEGYSYVIRLKANAVLERKIEHLLTRSVGRPSHKPRTSLKSVDTFSQLSVPSEVVEAFASRGTQVSCFLVSGSSSPT